MSKRLLIQLSLLGFGMLILLYGISVMLVSVSDFGALVCLLISIPLILWGVFYQKIRKYYKYPRVRNLKYIIQALYISFFAFIITFTSMIIKYQNSVDNPSGVQVIIVLGGALNGEEPSPTLKRRLDIAYECYTKNPEAKIIVSGGQGSDEIISEAESMSTYLVSKGVPLESIILEKLATNTIQNFEFSKSIIDNTYENPSELNIVFATSDYHTYRASLIADEVGLKTQGIGSKTTLFMKPSSYIRESFSLAYYKLTHLF